jgi:hypothetical protein
MEIVEDGWPPASVESLWAVDLGDGTARLDNTPWFVCGVASDDIIRVGVDDGVRSAGETVRASRNCPIRLIVLEDDGSTAARQTVLKTSTVSRRQPGEGIDRYRMVALDAPPDADLPQIRKVLEHGAAKEWWHWEEGCVTAAWRTTASN